MTKTQEQSKHGQRVPPPSRRQVLSEKPETWAARLRAEPGTWMIIGSGGLDRLGVMSQTAYRIRYGRIKAFVVGQEESNDGWRFHASVSTARNVEGREHPVELWACWAQGNEPENANASE